MGHEAVSRSFRAQNALVGVGCCGLFADSLRTRCGLQEPGNRGDHIPGAGGAIAAGPTWTPTTVAPRAACEVRTPFRAGALWAPLRGVHAAPRDRATTRRPGHLRWRGQLHLLAAPASGTYEVDAARVIVGHLGVIVPAHHAAWILHAAPSRHPEGYGAATPVARRYACTNRVSTATALRRAPCGAAEAPLRAAEIAPGGCRHPDACQQLQQLPGQPRMPRSSPGRASSSSCGMRASPSRRRRTEPQQQGSEA